MSCFLQTKRHGCVPSVTGRKQSYLSGGYSLCSSWGCNPSTNQQCPLQLTFSLPAANYLSRLLEETSEQKWIYSLLCCFHLHRMQPELDASNSNIPGIRACGIKPPRRLLWPLCFPAHWYPVSQSVAPGLCWQGGCVGLSQVGSLPPSWAQLTPR